MSKSSIDFHGYEAQLHMLLPNICLKKIFFKIITTFVICNIDNVYFHRITLVFVNHLSINYMINRANIHNRRKNHGKILIAGWQIIFQFKIVLFIIFDKAICDKK